MIIFFCKFLKVAVIQILSNAKQFFHYLIFRTNFPNLLISWPSTVIIDDFSVAKIGSYVRIGPYSEIVVLKESSFSNIPGELSIGSKVIIGFGANIRAAGGIVNIGDNCLLAQNVSLIAANHKIDLTMPYMNNLWDSARTGVALGRNVWVGANALILPGVHIGDNVVIGAGSVVTHDIPSNEVWAGVPAKFVKKITE